MAILIGFGFHGSVNQASGSEPVAGGHAATVAALPVLNAMFDSGAARGTNAADIPLSGTTDAPDGAQIEARIVRADTLAEVHPWTAIATAASGAWSGTFPAATRNANRLKAEVRVQGSAEAVRTPGDFMVGHVVVLVGQSEDDRMMFLDRAEMGPVPTFADADAEDSFFFLPKTADGIMGISSSSPRTRPIAHMANTFTRNAPGEKVLFIDGTQSGTSYLALAKDADTSRNWDTSFANAVRYVQNYGSDVGVMMSTWTASTSASFDNFRRQLYPLHTGRYAAEDGGGDYPLGTDLVIGGNTATGRSYDHLFWDFTGLDRGIFDTGKTRMFFYGPHRFEDAVGAEFAGTKQDTRTSIRNWVADPVMAPIMLPKGPEILTYQNGTASTTYGGNEGSKRMNGAPDATSWTDWSHPSDWDPDGLPARARHTAIAMLYALGRGPAAAQNRHVPTFNRADWNTTHVDLWYEAPDGSTPPITTTRLARGDDPIPATFPHRTEVAGFRINGVPAQRVEIVGGTVRVFPDGIRDTFISTDTLNYGLGGASGNVQWPEDGIDLWWKNLPVADMGFDTVEGIALEPLPKASDIANTLAGAALLSFPSYAGDGRLPAGVTGLTFRYRVRLTNPSVVQRLMRIVSGPEVTWVGNGNRAQFAVVTKNSGGATLSNLEMPDQSFPLNIMQTLTISMDLAAGITSAWVGEPGQGLRADDTFASGSGQFVTNRDFIYVMDTWVDPEHVPSGDIEFVEYWRSAIPNPTQYATAPDLGGYDGAGAWTDGADGIGEPRQHMRADGGGLKEYLGTKYP